MLGGVGKAAGGEGADESDRALIRDAGIDPRSGRPGRESGLGVVMIIRRRCITGKSSHCELHSLSIEKRIHSRDGLPM
jgi:hypothetical protein